MKKLLIAILFTLASTAVMAEYQSKTYRPTTNGYRWNDTQGSYGRATVRNNGTRININEYNVNTGKTTNTRCRKNYSGVVRCDSN